MSRYQGLVALEGGNLEAAAHEYFLRSEQFRPGCGLRSVKNGVVAQGPTHRWRAGGMLLQFLPKAPERARQADLHPGDAPEGVETHTVAEDDAWVEGQSLISTVEDVGLIHPDFRARGGCTGCFTTWGAGVSAIAARAQCSCSREAVRRCSELRGTGPRRHGQRRQGGRDLRVLQFGL